MTPPRAFAEYIKAASFQEKPAEKLVRLTNVTFFLGAGFSKSWDESHPNREQLFSFDITDYSDDLFEFVENIGYIGLRKFDFARFKDMAYQLSMQKKYPSVRSRYIDLYNLNMIENEINSVITKRFKEIAGINYIQKNKEKLVPAETLTPDQQRIVQFFRWIHAQGKSDTEEIPEGVRPHFITTNYDFLIESIHDEILGPEESHLLYSYRGFTPVKTNGVRTPRTVFKHWRVQTLIKINGGFEIYKEANHAFSIDYRLKSDAQLKENAPVLIVPNREQDYTGAYFQTIFPKAVRILQESQILVIVGYSLSDEDALIRLLLRQFAEENVDATEKALFFIDRMSESEQMEKLQSVFPYLGTSQNRYHIYPYSGDFTDWVKGVLESL